MDVSKNIREGAYKVVAPKNFHVPEGVDFRDWRKTPEFIEANKEFSRLTIEAEARFKADLETQFRVKSHPKANLLFRKAWELGHDTGHDQVFYYYDDLVELIKG